MLWRHLNICQFGIIHARLPRVQCPGHKVRQVSAQWAEPGSRFTVLFENWVIDILKECDVTGTNHLTDTSWSEAWSVMEKAVERGPSRKKKGIPDCLGIDEKSFTTRHRYETILCDLRSGTLECVCEDRRQDSSKATTASFLRRS